MSSEPKSANAVWEKFSHALLATTCLTVSAGSVLPAATVITVEGTVPAPSDFPNSTPGYLLPYTTNEVKGSVSNLNPDWFEFHWLLGGSAFTLLGKYNPLRQEKGVTFEVFDSANQHVGIGRGGGLSTLEGQGGTVSGTIPNNGTLIVEVHSSQPASATYQFNLTAENGPTPEPAGWATAGLGLATALAWRRKTRHGKVNG